MNDTQKRNIQKLIDLAVEKSSDKNLSKEERLFLKNELVFYAEHPSLVDDFFAFLNKGYCGGTKNIPNSMLYFLFSITNIKADVDKELRYGFVKDDKSSRISPPDIDIDFEHRDVILEHICNVYGKEKMALIGTAISFKPKAAIQFSAKYCNVAKSKIFVSEKGRSRFSAENDQEAKRMSKIIPTGLNVSLDQWLGKDEKFTPPSSRIKRIAERVQEEEKKNPKVFEIAKALEGTIKSYGTHAAGVVVSENPITDDVPLHYTKQVSVNGYLGGKVNTIYPTTQFAMGEIEKDIGLLKFDFLQLDNLRQISLVLKLIKEKYNEVNFDIDNLETNDTKVFKTIDDCKLEGLFQISGRAFAGYDYPVFKREKKGDDWVEILDDDGNPIPELDECGKIVKRHRKGVIEVIGCSSFDDIVVSNALGRPGPLASDMHYKYRDGKKNPAGVTYSHDKLFSILKPTYGQMCYQEQLISMAMSLAGFTFSEADKLRKACSKKDKGLLDEIESGFRIGCERRGVSDMVISEMWGIAIAFGEYAFNKSHCLSGDTEIFDKKNEEWVSLEDLSKMEEKEKRSVVLDSYLDGEIVEDEIVDVFSTGYKDICEIELENGMFIKCTMGHKFLCSDGEFYKILEIIREDLEIIEMIQENIF